eukprot:TRINITY_DN5329_c0_g1_i3.p1 TRINITY_DN5329_c0_g1~~TRINITY_DN5329_c0_g1_i3.p1  ORF type:complete len:212 (+),score=11.11 TRINITY_DN5329_c0_g1_i3:90-725(+)
MAFGGDAAATMRTPAVTVLLCFSLLWSSALGLACTSSVVLSSPVRRSRKEQTPLALVLLRPPEDGVLVPVSAPAADCRAIVAARDALEAAVAPLTTIAKTVSGRSESGFFECCMEVGLTTVGSLVSGGVLGYIIGWGIGIAQQPEVARPRRERSREAWATLSRPCTRRAGRQVRRGASSQRASRASPPPPGSCVEGRITGTVYWVHAAPAP